ncbi:MAG: DNA-3-methyladenine glycosylase, partial [Anaerolineales bacterium]|nr:DNA-3-methyladenine glycosylase [Anaerolineales bacterium]
MSKLPSSFFLRPTLTVARECLGKKLVRIESDGRSTSGTITEVECYIGETDLACHASVGITERTKMLYGEPGTLYIYLIYGMHWM